MPLLNDIRIMMVRELNTLKGEINCFSDDEMIWKILPGVTNSVGNLVLHVCGNLKHFIGTSLGNTNYIRQRDLEFSTSEGSRTSLIKELDETIDVINSVFINLNETQLNSDFPEMVGGVQLKTDRFLIHLSIHLGFHLGQASYLRRIITQNGESTQPLSLEAIAEP